MDGLTAVLALIASAASAAAASPPAASAGTARVVRADARSRLVPQSCVRLTPLRRGRVEAVLRSGRLTRSVTIRAFGDTHVYGCDTTGAAGEGPSWCDVASGIVSRGRVRDPRLGLLCRTSRRDRVATAWANPLRRARTLVVVDGPRRDRYPVAGRLPVRIATTHGVRYDRSEAVFVVIQYDSHGRRLARTRLAARVAG